MLWRTRENIFYLYNFGYIGTAIAVGIGLYVLLPRRKKPAARRLSQLLVGLYMMGFLGFYQRENMQLEGFFFYVLAGLFTGVSIHYLVAKIAGPLLFSRGFCSWACWTAMVLDLLPYKRPARGRLAAKWEALRGVHFVLSLLLVLCLWFVFGDRSLLMPSRERVWFVAGNVLYFASGIALAFGLRDNRAFCKYLCPITVLMKISTRLSLLKIGGDRDACSRCGACCRACPMSVDVMGYIVEGLRVLSTECIFCLTCTTVCPENILAATLKVDRGGWRGSAGSRKYRKVQGETAAFRKIIEVDRVGSACYGSM